MDIHVVRNGDSCLAVTGETGAKSTVHVWDTDGISSKVSFSLGGSARGISTLSLSPCQRYVACCDKSNDHIVTIYNIQRKKLIVQVSSGTEPIDDI